jgi:glycosyltransferase involved in cell wall biosynthesis
LIHVRIALATNYLTPTGGIELQMLQMSRELSRRGHRIDLLYNRNGELHSEFQEFCYTMSEVPTFISSRKWDIRGHIRLLPAVWAAVRTRPDVVHVVGLDQLGFGLVSGLISRAPVVCNLVGLSSSTIMAGMMPRLCVRADRFVACSSFVRNQFIEAGIDPAQITVVHNGIELEEYPPATVDQRAAARRIFGLPEDAFVTLYFGRLEAEKGVEVLLEAWRHLALPPDRARLLVVGSAAPDGNPEGRVQDLQSMAPPGCHWLPGRRDVITPLHAADVVAVPSMYEAFGRVVVEGLAAGLPVVASRVGGIPEILDGDLDAFLFERGSAVELAERLASLVDWRNERPSLGERCTASAERFGIGRMVDEVERILRDTAA